jgi:hypothetical protein
MFLMFSIFGTTKKKCGVLPTFVFYLYLYFILPTKKIKFIFYFCRLLYFTMKSNRPLVFCDEIQPSIAWEVFFIKMLRARELT